MLMCLHGSSLDWKSKLVLVGFYLCLETRKKVGWKGPSQPNPCLRQGCLHRTRPVKHENLQEQRSTSSQQAEAPVLPLSLQGILSLQPISPVVIIFSYYYYYHILYYNFPYWQTSLMTQFCVFFVNLFPQQFPSLLRGVTFSALTHLCSNWGLFWTTGAQPLSTVFPRTPGERVSAVQVKYRALLLLVLGLLHRYFPLLSFQPTQAAGDFFFYFLKKVIPCLKIVFSSIHTDSNSLKMALVALLFLVEPRSELSVNS